MDLSALQATVEPMHQNDSVRLANQTLMMAAPDAAAAIVALATVGANESIRLRAAQYILDRVLGRPGEEGNGTDVWDEFLRDVVRVSE